MLPFAVRVRADGIAIGSRDEGQGIVLLTESRGGVAGKRIGARPQRGSLGWSWELSDSELELSSGVVRRRQGAQAHVFPYRLWGGFAPFAVDAKGQLSNGAWVFGRPFVQGADGVAYDIVRWEVRAAAQELVLHLDDSALPARAYPYIIDPAIGPYSATVAANFTAAPFNQFTKTWDDPARALTNNNAKAKVADMAPAPSADVTDGLYISGFGFNVAPLAVVTGGGLQGGRRAESAE